MKGKIYFCIIIITLLLNSVLPTRSADKKSERDSNINLYLDVPAVSAESIEVVTEEVKQSGLVAAINNEGNREEQEYEIHICYPQIRNHPSATIEGRINRYLKRTFLDDVLRSAENDGGQGYIELETIPQNGISIHSQYTVTLKQGEFLSIYAITYIYVFHAANGLERYLPVNLNLRTGTLYNQDTLFDNENQDKFVEIVSAKADRQVPEHYKIPTINKFVFTPKDLLILFDECEIAAHSIGLIEIPVPYSEIKNLMLPDCPLRQLTKNDK